MPYPVYPVHPCQNQKIPMYAEIAVNIEAGLANNFHYHLPRDLEETVQVGCLVEVEFGRRLAQGIVVAFSDDAPVADTKPIISLIDDAPVVRPWQIELAQWLSQQYLTPFNLCLRLLLPPGLTRMSDITLAVNPYWDGEGRLTETQAELISLLRQKGDMRGRQLKRALPKMDWRTAATQLIKRSILQRGSILEPPRSRPKQIRTAELSAGPRQIKAAAMQLGRANKQADLLDWLAASDDPLPPEDEVLTAVNATPQHLNKLLKAGLIQRSPAVKLVVGLRPSNDVPAQWRDLIEQLPLPVEQIDPGDLAELETAGLIEQIAEPARLGLAIPARAVAEQLYRLRGGERYHRILSYLARAATAVSLTDLYADTDSNISHLRKLSALDLIKLGSEEVWRDPLADKDFAPSEAPSLTHDQERAWEKIERVMLAENGGDGRRPFLLHGVTGSGKTEIYMRAIDLALERGQTAIVLVPEIALTPQTVRRFAARFPGRAAVLHSRLSDGERYDTWRRARQGLFDIVVGPRSALFTPLDNLGVIVLDEEHDGSYKQTPPIPPPYYHARETAVKLGQISNAIVILGSATPDLVSYHRAQAGRYELIELPRRIMGHRERLTAQAARIQRDSQYGPSDDDPEDAWTIPLPPIQIVDLRQELRAGNRTIFSRALRQAIDETLARQEQAILFLNRRGTASFVICRDCGLTLKCPKCDTPLTYHRPNLHLVCHHCGRKEPPHQQCPQCGSDRIRYFGLGTEQVEALVRAEWPDARVVRWDRDTTAGRGDAHETLLASFINQEADILVGTQMIAKGLDLPLVTLVGVISADVSLGLPDYQTGERAYQVLSQVAGRAGRGLLGGRVIIQTYQPDHYAIQAAAEHDYVSFYLEEIRFRTQHGLPPFRRLARLLIIDPINDRAQREATRLAKALRLHVRDKQLGATEILGPTPPFFSRIDGRYRWQILARTPDPVRLLADFDVPAPWLVDIDPESVL
jgi:primosomal protein N' (replication factor Y) (superfamily II helicase)